MLPHTASTHTHTLTHSLIHSPNLSCILSLSPPVKSHFKGPILNPFLDIYFFPSGAALHN